MQGLQVVSDTLDSFALGNVWAAEPVSLLLCPDLTCRVIYIINSATLPKACRHKQYYRNTVIAGCCNLVALVLLDLISRLSNRLDRVLSAPLFDLYFSLLFTP